MALVPTVRKWSRRVDVCHNVPMKMIDGIDPPEFLYCVLLARRAAVKAP